MVKIIMVLFHIYGAQAGALDHLSVEVRQILQQVFPNQVVGIDYRVEWPPKLPDLTPYNFFL